MLGWAIAFFIAAVLVALLGFMETATLAAMAKVLFWIFMIGCVASLVMHVNRTRAVRRHSMIKGLRAHRRHGA
jgi:uncharacterized membrane protein YtjA (UPF0391 family)